MAVMGVTVVFTEPGVPIVEPIGQLDLPGVLLVHLARRPLSRGPSTWTRRRSRHASASERQSAPAIAAAGSPCGQVSCQRKKRPRLNRYVATTVQLCLSSSYFAAYDCTVVNRPRFSSVSPKGQITLPADFRRQLGIGPKDQVAITMADGKVEITPALARFRRHYQSVPALTESMDWKEIEAIVADEIAVNAASEGLPE